MEITHFAFESIRNFPCGHVCGPFSDISTIYLINLKKTNFLQISYIYKQVLAFVNFFNFLAKTQKFVKYFQFTKDIFIFLLFFQITNH